MHKCKNLTEVLRHGVGRVTELKYWEIKHILETLCPPQIQHGLVSGFERLNVDFPAQAERLKEFCCP
jgi:hypothetical protein